MPLHRWLRLVTAAYAPVGAAPRRQHLSGASDGWPLPPSAVPVARAVARRGATVKTVAARPPPSLPESGPTGSRPATPTRGLSEERPLMRGEVLACPSESAGSHRLCSAAS